MVARPPRDTAHTARRYSTSAELSHHRPSFDRPIKCSRLLSPISITSPSNHHLPHTMSSYIRSVVPPSAFGEPRVRAANRRRSSSLSDIVDSLATRVGLKAKTPPSPLRPRVPTSSPKSILKRRSVDSDVSFNAEEPEESVSEDNVSEDAQSTVDSNLERRAQLVFCRTRGFIRIPLFPPPPPTLPLELFHQSDCDVHGQDDDDVGRVRFVVPDVR
ncbi:hypothetical protein C8F01DRAFT_667431 [Mycena amicta]|nr:hypothetical protein C8F01DRAFT_667431 [Mycena amicta]